MEEEANSWLRRAKFSQTVCHRLDSSRLASIPITIQRDRNFGVKSKPVIADSNPKPCPSLQQIQRSRSTNKSRCVSPLPQSTLSDAFKEARSDQKRFSTPTPRRRESERQVVSKLIDKNSQRNRESDSRLKLSTIPPRRLSLMKIYDQTKTKKELSWAKCFEYGGGKVTSVETADEWMVDLSQLYLGLRFAHGAHSQLYHGIYKDEPVAAKIIRIPEDDENGALAARLEKQFTREVTLLSRLHHQNIIKLIAACRRPPVFCILSEYLSQGSLRAYLHKLEHKSLSLDKLIAVALDIARGMEFIHSQGVIHRDLKPENVLMNEDFCMKIADFGIACEEAYCDLLVDDPGTYRWMAPEMIKRKKYGRKVDVYSFGLILWEMMAGTIPYEEMTPIQAAFAVVNKNLRPAIPGGCPPAMRALIEQCWSVKPEKRPEFWEVVKVLEQFESSLAHDGTLNLVQTHACQNHKNGLNRWIQKLGPIHHPTSSTLPNPKFK